MAKKLTILRATSMGAALVLTSLFASAADEAFSPAAVCNVQPGSGILFGSQGQLQNSSAGNQTAVCGIGQEQIGDQNDDVIVHYHDGGQGNLNCSVVENTANWDWVLNGDSKWGCSTPGG